MIKDKIKKEIIERYSKISSDALELARKSVFRGQEKKAKEIILMVECYLSDAKHFFDKGNYINAYGCLNYAHGWLDCGARLKIFDVKDNKLFTI